MSHQCSGCLYCYSYSQAVESNGYGSDSSDYSGYGSDDFYDNDDERSYNNGYNDVSRFRPSSDETIFDDMENTHDSAVQQSITESVKNLLASTQLAITLEDIKTSDIGELTKRRIDLLCRQKEIHYRTEIDYKTLLLHVWQRITESEHKQHMFKILRRHIWEAEGMCFTGIFNHTLSVLVGFCEDIHIQISDSARIGSIIVAARQGVDRYDSRRHHDRAREQLLDLGYDDDTIKPWLVAILDEDDGDSSNDDIIEPWLGSLLAKGDSYSSDDDLSSDADYTDAPGTDLDDYCDEYDDTYDEYDDNWR